MKIVVIGGGIAGITAGICLKGNHYDVVVNERSNGLPHSGHAFLMQDDALQVLAPFQKHRDLNFPGYSISKYTLKRPDGREVKKVQLNHWKCVRRNDFLLYLQSMLPEDILKDGRKFSHFIYEGDTAVAAAFANGEVEYGDLFIGADGAHSAVREKILGAVQYTPTEVKEIVGSAHNPELYKLHLHEFTKFQSGDRGLSFGMIPTAPDEFVWFIQYDPRIADSQHRNPDETRNFCFDLLQDFPEVTKEILLSTDFAKCYLWNTHDFDVLPGFHSGNIALIGDAAHLALPFTSAGATNAISDASTLSTYLGLFKNHTQAFHSYYNNRKEQVKEHLELGRKLKYDFLNPLAVHEDNIQVPLIPEEVDNTEYNRAKPIQVLYFTDPICSTCWIIQPILRKLKLEYDEYVNIEYRMGGLLKTWDDLSKKQGPIRTPNDAAKHWDMVRALNEMPMDGSIWLDDPLHSSYPPSIAFKAAQLQSTEKAILFLRRIKELIFLEKKNIIKWHFLSDAAFELGLDVARLKRDFDGKAQEHFREDLELANQLNVTGFPTLFFENKNGDRQFLKGYQEYPYFEKIILELRPDAKKKPYDPSPENLFKHFSTMTGKEFAFLSNTTTENAELILNNLFELGFIDRYESSSGMIWLAEKKNDPEKNYSLAQRS